MLHVQRNKEDRRLRMVIYFDNQDAWYPYRLWPKWVQNDILLQHKKNNQRYRLFLFFTYNGLPPHAAVDWITASDITPSGDLIPDASYDSEAVRHFKQLLHLAESKKLFKDARNIWNMQLGKVDQTTTTRQWEKNKLARLWEHNPEAARRFEWEQSNI